METLTPKDVRIAAGPVTLAGDLCAPPAAPGLVLFAHGSGSSRKSPRNIQVALALQEAGLATLLFDLLTPEEEHIDMYTREHRFNVHLLTQRLHDASLWVDRQAALHRLPLGYFGASTGSAAALAAAAQLGPRVAAVVSRGGRPDLVPAATLARVSAAVLLIVGSRDDDVLELNRQAYQCLAGEKHLTVVAGATHLFEEPGTLNNVARLAAAWFGEHLHARRRVV
jgi:putative phosphoribosyl transferase